MNAPTQIAVSKNGTTILDTAGKYCDRHIAIMAEVPAGDYNISATENEDGSQNINITDATADDNYYTVTVSCFEMVDESGAWEASPVTVNYISESGVASSVVLEVGQSAQIKVYRHSSLSVLGTHANCITNDYVIGYEYTTLTEYEGLLIWVYALSQNYITVRIDHDGAISFGAHM